MEIPAISIIVPLYNAEKYVGDCLDSILGQTFTNFEVIVVDDCSTDSSPAIVESYRDKFGGRLTLIKTKQNSGNAGYTARNKGLSFSRGEYVWFVDADDFISNTALEELYTAAKEFDADIVYTGRRYHYIANNEVMINFDGTGYDLKDKGIEDKSVLIIDDAQKNLSKLFQGGGFRTPWTKFVRRDFLSENSTTFYELLSGADYIWTMEIFASAKRFVRIPNAVYFWREDSTESMTRKHRPPIEQINIWNKAFICFAQALINLTKKLEVLQKNPNYCYMILNSWFEYCFGRNFEARLQVSSDKVYDILRREFENKSDFNLIIPFFFSLIDTLQKDLLITQQQPAQLTEEVKARIADLEKSNKYKKAYIEELEKFVADSQQYIAELEAELTQLKSAK